MASMIVSTIKALRSGDLSTIRKYKVKLAMLREYKRRPGGAGPVDIFMTHRKGFTVNDWNLLGMTDETYKGYLSTKQYYSGHPYNGTYSAWIDDKLTLWYMCQGTELEANMPVYYFQTKDSRVMAIGDGLKLCNDSEPRIDDIADLLENRGALAIKMLKGTFGKGFYKAEFHDSNYYLNGEQLTKAEWCERISKLDGYIFGEYIRPHEDLARVFPDTPNTLRYQVCRVDGKLQFLKSFIRFGSTSSGYVENFNAGGVLCYIDAEGNYDTGYVIDMSEGLSTRTITTHPDTGAHLKGIIPHWDKVQSSVAAFDRLFPQFDYLGFDFVITDDNRAIMLEANALTSLDALQLDCSLLDLEVGKAFFTPRISG